MAAITDLSTATSAADGDYFVISAGGTDQKITRANVVKDHVKLATDQTISASHTFTGAPVFDDKLKFLAAGALTTTLAGRSISSLADAGLTALTTLFGVASINGLLIVHNANSAYVGMFVLRGGLNGVVEALDPASQFSVAAGTAGTNIIYSGGYYLENKTGGACSYNLWLLQ